MKTFLKWLGFWKRPLILLTVFGVSAFLVVTSGGPAIGVPALLVAVGVGTLSGFDIYNHLAERHFLVQKLGINPEENYKKELRRLEKLRREAVRKTFSYKNYGSGSTYFREALDAEKRLEAYRNGEDYPPKGTQRMGRDYH